MYQELRFALLPISEISNIDQSQVKDGYIEKYAIGECLEEYDYISHFSVSYDGDTPESVLSANTLGYDLTRMELLTKIDGIIESIEQENVE